MEKKNKALFLTFLCIATALVYFFSSFFTIKPALSLSPMWTLDITSAKKDADKDEDLLPFKLGKNIGYFTTQGKIVLFERAPYKAAISKNFFAPYPATAENIKVFGCDSAQRFSIKTAGFPFFKEERVFIFPPGGFSVALIDTNSGEILDIYEHTSPITAFDSAKGGICAGFADGTFLIFDNKLKLRVNLTPGGSDTPVILGASISEDGKHFACVSGLSPQRILLYKDENTYEKIIFHEFLKKNLVRQTFVRFSREGLFAYFDISDELLIVDAQKLFSKRIPLKGAVLDIQECDCGAVFVLSKEGALYTVSVLEDYENLAGSFDFEASAAFILCEKNFLYVGRDSKISQIKISKE